MARYPLVSLFRDLFSKGRYDLCTVSASGGKLPIPVRMLAQRARCVPEPPAVIRLSDDLVKIRRNSRLPGLNEWTEKKGDEWCLEVDGDQRWYRGCHHFKTVETEEKREEREAQIERCNEVLSRLVQKIVPIVRPKVKWAERKVKPAKVGLNNASKSPGAAAAGMADIIKRHPTARIPLIDIVGSKIPWTTRRPLTVSCYGSFCIPSPRPEGFRLKSILRSDSLCFVKNVKFAIEAEEHVYEPLPSDEAQQKMKLTTFDDTCDGHYCKPSCSWDGYGLMSVSNRRRRRAAAVWNTSWIPTRSQSSGSSNRRYIF
ncbi:hypothetical protein K491DRAFT_721882 [Lophiostoma macrostomum CBS 122681]|uniref:Uncharacterized protein n=1 Tax=Lophiostoma macrostomum CBS 122681 TaxID=1314788 RepID=A0A6A6SS34_9PLEO|nr:hypothetical protein K491DRAFT_721882 [Lophiostoma macrostomum CBS 122681]